MNSDSGYTFYIIKKANDVPCPYDTYTIVGRTPDGRWLQYLDSDNICKTYVNASGRILYAIKKFTVQNDMIIMYYSYFTFESAPNRIYGELRFKWDSAAQWFGVKHIVY